MNDGDGDGDVISTPLHILQFPHIKIIDHSDSRAKLYIL